MLILKDADTRELLSMEEAITAMEESYHEVAQGSAKNLPRQRIRTHPKANGMGYFFNCIPGLLPSRGIMAVRLDSIVREVHKQQVSGRYFNDQYCGWVVLFSQETGEPLAILDDFVVSAIRVGATTAVAVNLMARKDAKRLALFGSGKQARTNLEGVAKVRQLDQVRVYSPNPDHRKLLAEELTPTIGVEIIPVNSPAEAVEGADIILCASNSMTPVFNGQWLRPGMLVATITGGSEKSLREVTGAMRREVDETTMERSARIVITSKEQVIWDDQKNLREPTKNGENDWGKIVELCDLLTGAVPGRKDEEEINLYASNTGTGNQFAAAGAIIYEKAKARSMGIKIPTEQLMINVKDWSDRGYFPSP
jgi:ornithine cyclodeaminase/alanine dehydrogenase-like protein (mu-crystallin family)